MTDEPSAERPPGWARTPTAFRSRGNAVFPLEGAAGSPPRLVAASPSLRGALGRLAPAIRLTAGLLFLAPLLELVAITHPIAPGDAIWRLAFAQSLPSALMLPTVGTLLLAVVAVARPSRLSSGLAFGACASGMVLAGLAVGTLIVETLPHSTPSPAVATLTSSILHGLLVVAVLCALGWGVFRHGHLRGVPLDGAALPRPRPPGIDLLD